jgi:hypothetical protein
MEMLLPRIIPLARGAAISPVVLIVPLARGAAISPVVLIVNVLLLSRCDRPIARHKWAIEIIVPGGFAIYLLTVGTILLL